MSDDGAYGLLWIPHKKNVFSLSEYVAKGSSGRLLVETNPHDPNALNREKIEVDVNDAFHVEEVHLQNQVPFITLM